MDIKHLTARFAWHDSGWNGRICKNPLDNIYCRGNHSLLSSRIQRRINLELEESNKTKPISEIVSDYVPPCYWCINAFGKEKCKISDPHPFSDSERWKKKFESVDPLVEEIDEFSIFTWCFKFSFAEENSPEGRYPADLEERAEKYLSRVAPERSIVFFYANFSNPVTGDDYKRLLLGAGVVKEVKKPKRYNFPSGLLDEIRKEKGMQNFPEIAWQFRIKIDPEMSFVLPYQKYLEWIDEAEDDEEKDRRMNILKGIAIPIDEPTLYPFFKYVSMQVSHDQALYLTYLLKRSVEKMKEYRVVRKDVLDSISQKIERILKILWRERGKYPGFTTATEVLLKNDFGNKSKEVAKELEQLIKDRLGDVSVYLEGKGEISTEDTKLRKALRKLEKEKEILSFLSIFNFTAVQMEKVMEIIDKKGLGTIKSNPYLLLEEYAHDVKEHWDWDESDSGIDTYHMDIPLLPDPEYANWIFEEFDATSPERLRAIISKILLKRALNYGDTYLTRGEILEEIKNYPLYYGSERFTVRESELERYESLPLFKEKFIFDEDPETGEVIYQLRSIRRLEEKIENVVKSMLGKRYSIDPDTEKFIEKAVDEDLRSINIEIDKKAVKREREKMYRGALENRFYIISGRAGTGKTQAIANLVRYFRNKTRGKIFVLSPTGKSNLVIRDRLEKFGLHNDPMINVSTVHRFLFGGIIEAIEDAGFNLGKYYRDVKKLNEYIDKILSGQVEMFQEFEKFAEGWKLKPSVVIIDEASMVDELMLAVLLTMINEFSLKHLILVGDEKQLPPIGVGRPFSDVIFFLKNNGYEENLAYLKTNLRFSPDSALGGLSDIFAEDKRPMIKELEHFCSLKDESLEIISFSDIDNLKEILRKILAEISESSPDKSLFELFKDMIEREGVESVQIITPRRAGDFGSWSLNLKAVMEGNPNIIPGSKLICEENIYINVQEGGRKRKVLGLANGSMGYLKGKYLEFREIKEVFSKYGRSAGSSLVKKILNSIENPLTIDKSVDFAYAITVHKSQGSDFDYVILVLKDVTSFVTRELIYTALTRAKKKLYLLIHEHLAENLPSVLWEIYENSATEKIKTMLFSTKRSPFKPYILELKSGEKIGFRSKIEYIIGKTLDELGIKFDYEPEDLKERGIYPDFRISINGITYYWEHLGRLDDRKYRERWLRKLEIYRELGLEDNLITTSESEEFSNPEKAIIQIVQDLKRGVLKTTESGYPSKHHYEL